MSCNIAPKVVSHFSILWALQPKVFFAFNGLAVTEPAHSITNMFTNVAAGFNPDWQYTTAKLGHKGTLVLRQV